MNLTDLAIQHLPIKRKSNPRGGYYICCPMCLSMGESRNDTKFRGGFTPQPDQGFIYHCHNCHFATGWSWNGRVSKNLMKFLTKLGVDSKKVPIRLRLLQQNERAPEATIEIETYDVAMEFKTVELPAGAYSFESWVEDDDPPGLFYDAFDYLANRGAPVFDGWNYFWTEDKYYNWNKRIIIPFYHNGKIVGYTGRRFINSKKISKYFSQQPEHFLFNQDKLEGDAETIILVEGVFDAISIKGVATLGNILTKKQINLLNLSKKRIILVPDRNKAGRKLLEQAIGQNWEVSIPDWDRGVIDCANATKRYGKLFTLESIYKSAMNNAMKSRLRFEIARI